MTELEERKGPLLPPIRPLLVSPMLLRPFPPFRGFLPLNKDEDKEEEETEGNCCGCKVGALSQCSLASQPEAEIPGMFLEANPEVEADEAALAAAAADAAEAWKKRRREYDICQGIYYSKEVVVVSRVGVAQHFLISCAQNTNHATLLLGLGKEKKEENGTWGAENYCEAVAFFLLPFYSFYYTPQLHTVAEFFENSLSRTNVSYLLTILKNCWKFVDQSVYFVTVCVRYCCHPRRKRRVISFQIEPNMKNYPPLTIKSSGFR